MKELIAILVTASAITVGTIYGVMAQDDNEEMKVKEPKELVSARTAYKNQVKAAVDPIKAKYVQTLESMKKKYGAGGDTAGMIAVQKELDSLKDDLDTKTSEEKQDKYNFSGTWKYSGGTNTTITWKYTVTFKKTGNKMQMFFDNGSIYDSELNGNKLTITGNGEISTFEFSKNKWIGKNKNNDIRILEK